MMRTLLGRCLLLGTLAFPAYAAEDATWRVVFVASDVAAPTNFEQLQTVRQQLELRARRPVDLIVEVLDTYRFPLSEQETEVQALLDRKYRDIRLHLVIAFGPDALAFVGEHRARIWGHVPVLGFGVRPSSITDDGSFAHAVLVDFDLHGTLALALRLHPDTRHIALIAGNGIYERGWLNEVRNAMNGLSDQIDVIDLTERSIADLIRDVGRLPARTIGFFLPVSAERDGSRRPPMFTARQITSAANVPTYTIFEPYVGLGPVGGVAPDFLEHAHAAATMALRILEGEAEQKLRVTTPAKCMVDAGALDRWNLAASALPAGCEVRFQSASFWSQYFWYAASALATIALLGFLVVALLVQRRLSRASHLELLQQRNAAAHAGRLATVGELVGSITHQINQPLASMLINVDVGESLIESERPNRQKLVRDILEDLRRDVLRTSDIVNHIRSLLRPKEMESGPINLDRVVEDAVRLVSVDALRRGVTIDVEIGQSPLILGDRIQLEQVLLNLVLNALDAMADTPQHLRRLSICVRPAKAGHVDVVVSDFGHGLPVDREERVFESFFTTKPEGMGLGLSIARSIVQAHGGVVLANNAAEGGAIFTVRLPMMPFHPESQPAQTHEVAGAAT